MNNDKDDDDSEDNSRERNFSIGAITQLYQARFRKQSLL
jgi:hypothetical protein